MIRKEDLIYYSERLRVERDAAVNSPCPSARAVHRLFAQRYADLLADHGCSAEEPVSQSTAILAHSAGA